MGGIAPTRWSPGIHQMHEPREHNEPVSAYGVAILVWLLGSVPMALLVGLALRRSCDAHTIIDIAAAESVAEAEMIAKSAALRI